MSNQRLLLALAASCVLFIAGCEPTAQLPAATSPDGGGEAPAKVTVIKPTKKTLVKRTEQPGQIVAFQETPIFANVTGFISKVHVDIGDKVTGPAWDEKGNVTEPGTVLAEISIPELDQELLQKQALVAQALSQVQQAEAAIKVSEALQRSAEALASEAEAAVERVTADFNRYESEFKRITDLAGQGAVTKKLVEEAQNQSKSAAAAQKEAAAKIKSAKAVIDEKAAGVEQAQADLRAAKARHAVTQADEARLKSLQRYMTLYAPFTGMVTARNIDAGHLVQPGKTSSDKPLFVVVQADTLRIFVDVPDSDAALLEPKSEAVIRVPALGGGTFTGTVTRTAWVLNPVTRTLRAEIDLPNADGKLRPGLYVYADLKIAERKDVLALPRAAVGAQDNQAFCLSIDGGKIVRKPLVTGLRTADEVEIVSGLSGDEQVVAGNIAAYRDGQSVEAVPAVAK